MRHLTVTALIAFALTACTPNTVNTRNFADLVSGQVFEFHQEFGDLLVYSGTERFNPDQTVVYVTAEGGCLDGRWFVSDTNQICFNYGSDDVCWRLESRDLVPGAAFALSVDEDRAQAFLQTNSAIPQSCLG